MVRPLCEEEEEEEEEMRLDVFSFVLFALSGFFVCSLFFLDFTGYSLWEMDRGSWVEKKKRKNACDMRRMDRTRKEYIIYSLCVLRESNISWS